MACRELALDVARYTQEMLTCRGGFLWNLARLEPLTEKGLPKALLPIGDTTMIDRVLEWVEVSGIIGKSRPFQTHVHYQP